MSNLKIWYYEQIKELKDTTIPAHLKDKFINKFGNRINTISITSWEIEKFLKENK